MLVKRVSAGMVAGSNIWGLESGSVTVYYANKTGSKPIGLGVYTITIFAFPHHFTSCPF